MWMGFVIPHGVIEDQTKYMKQVFRHWTPGSAAYCPMPEKTCLIGLRDLVWEIYNLRDFIVGESVSSLLFFSLLNYCHY